MSCDIDDEPRDVHALDCAIWASPDPDTTCTCNTAEEAP